tara:strand:+ start:6149 stop:6736 length:588 start_codon:yes stop_codon:yes gene_type:complete
MLLSHAVTARTFNATGEAAEMALVKNFLRVSHTYDDETVIPMAVEAALSYCESCGNVAYVDCTVAALFDDIGDCGVALPLTALRSLTTVERMADGVFTVLAATAYDVTQTGTENVPAQLYINDGVSPSGVTAGAGYRVTYQAGLSDEINNLPQRLQAGVLLAVNHIYAHRNEQNPDKSFPRSVADLVTINRAPVL